jgi:hypothetical protein
LTVSPISVKERASGAPIVPMTRSPVASPNAMVGRQVRRVQCRPASQILRGPAGVGEEPRQLNQQTARNSERIFLLCEAVDELLQEFFSARGG